jgi:hypothetical protein
MSVMRPGDLRNAPTRPLPLEQEPIQRQAVIDQLGTPPAGLPGAQPVAQNSGTFARGGQVKQLPGGNLAGTVARTAAGTGAQLAGKILGNTAGGAAAGAGITVGTGMLADKVRTKEEMPTFGGEFGAYTDDMGRRFEGTGGGTAAGAIRGAGYGANPGLVAATGGLSVLGGAAIGAAIAAAKRHAKTAFSDFRVEDAADAIKSLYKKELGREASDDEVMGHLQNQGFDPTGGDRWVGEKNLFSTMKNIRESPEAQAFATRGAVVDQLGAGGAESAQVETGIPADAQVTSGSAANVPTGGGGRLEGFDADKLASGHDSPKYQVARVLQKYPSTPEGLRQALGEINALGLGTASIGGSKGDKLTFSGQTDPRFNGVTTFDVIRSAGTGGEAWQWLGEDGGAAPAAAAGPSAADSVDLGSRTQQPDVLDKDTLAQLRAELERIIAGSPDREALMAQMGGGNG